MEQLKAKQLDVFLPLHHVRRKWADRWKLTALPLFPGYVFCRFAAGEKSRVVATSGVVDIVRIGSDPAPIHDFEMEAIRRIASSNLKAEPLPRLVCGQRVAVRGGPLDGVQGTLMDFRNGYRLVVSIELLQRSVQVEVGRDYVVPCDPAQGKMEAVARRQPLSYRDKDTTKIRN